MIYTQGIALENILVPKEFIAEPRLEPSEKYLYILVLTRRPASISHLAVLAGINRNTAARHCSRLEALGWLKILKVGDRHWPIPVMPEAVESRLARLISQKIEYSPYKGEAICKAFLDQLMLCDVYVDNARPPFLRNPETGAPLELDRALIEEGIGYDYHGDQHYHSSDKYPERVFREIRKRDMIKRGLMQELGKEYYVVTKHDLNTESMLRLIPEKLRKRPVDRNRPILRALDEAGLQCSLNRVEWDREPDGLGN